MPSRSHAPATAGSIGQGGLVQHDGEAGVVGELVAHGPDAATGRVAQPARRRCGGEQRFDELGHRRSVGLDVGLEREVASRQHHRHPVIGDGAGDEDPVASLDEVGAEAAALRE